jgi:hypothetical protein
MMRRCLLRLSNNEQKYYVIFQKPIHQLVQTLMDFLSIKFGLALRRITRIISSLVYCYQPLAECDRLLEWFIIFSVFNKETKFKQLKL